MAAAEAIVNAIDMGANAVKVTLDGLDRSFTFRNGGPPLSGPTRRCGGWASRREGALGRLPHTGWL